MDDFVITRLRTALLAATLLAAASAHAQGPAQGARGLPDPTRPPASVYHPASAAGAESEPAAPELQSVLVAPQAGGRRVAVINGQMLRVGDKFNGAVLANVTDTEAVLVQGRQKQVLKLASAATIR
jgi:MSHA biogenesis protein MshK